MIKLLAANQFNNDVSDALNHPLFTTKFCDSAACKFYVKQSQVRPSIYVGTACLGPWLDWPSKSTKPDANDVLCYQICQWHSQRAYDLNNILMENPTTRKQNQKYFMKRTTANSDQRSFRDY